jgi:hypothetical protein
MIINWDFDDYEWRNQKMSSKIGSQEIVGLDYLMWYKLKALLYFQEYFDVAQQIDNPNGDPRDLLPYVNQTNYEIAQEIITQYYEVIGRYGRQMPQDYNQEIIDEFYNYLMEKMEGAKRVDDELFWISVKTRLIEIKEWIASRLTDLYVTAMELPISWEIDRDYNTWKVIGEQLWEAYEMLHDVITLKKRYLYLKNNYDWNSVAQVLEIEILLTELAEDLWKQKLTQRQYESRIREIVKLGWTPDFKPIELINCHNCDGSGKKVYKRGLSNCQVCKGSGYSNGGQVNAIIQDMKNNGSLYERMWRYVPKSKEMLKELKDWELIS